MKRLIAALVLASCTMPSLADIAWVNNTNIQKTLIQEGSFGGCMILLDKSVADVGLACPTPWVSLDCDGLFGSKLSAQRAFDSAQMAFALDKNVSLRVDDSKKFNETYCVAVRIDVRK
jgi:hypothetical protein